MSGVERAGEVPVVLTAAGVADGLWSEPVAVGAWCERRGLPVPDPVLRDSPRALRDHAAVAWSVKHFPHERFPGRPDWRKMYAAGVAPISGARAAARRAAVDA